MADIPQKYQGLEWVDSLQAGKAAAQKRAAEATKLVTSPTRVLLETGLGGGSACATAGLLDGVSPSLGPVGPSLPIALVTAGGAFVGKAPKIMAGALSVVNAHIYLASREGGRRLKLRYTKSTEAPAS